EAEDLIRAIEAGQADFSVENLLQIDMLLGLTPFPQRVYESYIELSNARAQYATAAAEAEVDEEFIEKMLDVSQYTNRSKVEADAETDEKGFEAERSTSWALIEINKDFDLKLEGFKDYFDAMARGWGVDVDEMHHDLEMITEDFPGFVAEQTVEMLAGPFEGIVLRLIDTFFEEV
ncbi:unnamed protein product, partial [marine sediment metagenome]